jgi:hypothetical protein
MSELSRWKENRVRQEIYKERLKQRENSANSVESNEASKENGLSIVPTEQSVSAAL